MILRWWPAVPLAIMARPLDHHSPYLQTYAAQVLGLGALACLLATLAITPLAAATGIRQAAWWRRWYGIWMLILGGAGLAVAASAGQGSASLRDWTGTLVVVLLIPLALTSNRWSQRWLGAYWKRWQRPLTWGAWAVTGIHLAILPATVAGTAYALASAPLMTARVPEVRKKIARRGGLRGWPRYALLATLAAPFAAGMGVIFLLEVRACACALWLLRP